MVAAGLTHQVPWAVLADHREIHVLPGQLDHRRNWTPERFDLGGPRFGVRRVKRDRPPISAQMGTVSTLPNDSTTLVEDVAFTP